MTVTNALIRRKAKAMLKDPLYQELRGWPIGAKEAVETVREWDRWAAVVEGKAKPTEEMQRIMDQELWK